MCGIVRPHPQRGHVDANTEFTSTQMAHYVDANTTITSMPKFKFRPIPGFSSHNPRACSAIPGHPRDCSPISPGIARLIPGFGVPCHRGSPAQNDKEIDDLFVVYLISALSVRIYRGSPLFDDNRPLEITRQH